MNHKMAILLCLLMCNASIFTSDKNQNEGFSASTSSDALVTAAAREASTATAAACTGSAGSGGAAECAQTAAKSAASANESNFELPLPNMNLLPVEELERIRKLQAQDKAIINDPLNAEQLTMNKLERLQTKTSPIFQTIFAANVLTARALMAKVINDAQNKDQAQKSAFNGANPYQLAAYLESRKLVQHTGPLGIKFFLQSILAADLPKDIKIVDPASGIDQLNALMADPEKPYQTALIVKEGNQWLNAIASDTYFEAALKMGLNVRYLLFDTLAWFKNQMRIFASKLESLNDPELINNATKHFNEALSKLKKIIIRAIEQGEQISTIEEMMQFLNDNDENVYAELAWYELIKNLNRIEITVAQNYFAQTPRQLIPAVVLQNIFGKDTDAKIRELKEAIQYFDAEVTRAEIVGEIPDESRLKEALGGKSLENIDLVGGYHDEQNYNPLLYAVYGNYNNTVQYIADQIKVYRDNENAYEKRIAELDKKLKDVIEQNAKLVDANKKAQSDEDKVINATVAEELKKKMKELEGEKAMAEQRLEIKKRVLKSLDRTVNGLNAYCLAKHLLKQQEDQKSKESYQKILEALAPLFKEECAE